MVPSVGPLPLHWILEAMVLVGAPALIAVFARAAPYCEFCGAYAEEFVPVRAFGAFQGVSDAVKAWDLDELASLQPAISDEVTTDTLELAACHYGDRDPHLLMVRVVRREKAGPKLGHEVLPPHPIREAQLAWFNVAISP